MRYWKCKCGKMEWFGSDSPGECEGCDECGTNAYGKTPTPHKWKKYYDQNTGEPYELCQRCYHKKKADPGLGAGQVGISSPDSPDSPDSC